MTSGAMSQMFNALPDEGKSYLRESLLMAAQFWSEPDESDSQTG